MWPFSKTKPKKAPQQRTDRLEGTKIVIEILQGCNTVDVKIFFGNSNINEQGDKLSSVTHIINSGGFASSFKNAVYTAGQRQNLPSKFCDEVVDSMNRLGQQFRDNQLVMDPEQVFQMPQGPNND